MKSAFHAYMTFARKERAGAVLLLSLLLLFLLYKVFQQLGPLQLQPDNERQELSARWEACRDKKNIKIIVAGEENIPLDINTADSLALVSLKGIGPKLAQRILLRRKELGAFSDYEQIWDVYHFSRQTKDELRKHTRIGNAPAHK